MKILITGGLGFIGSALGRRLIADGHDVVAIDNLTEQIHGPVPHVAVPDGLQFVRQDVRSIGRFPEIVDGCEVIYHLAAETGTAQSMYNIRDYVDVNECGTAALLEAIASSKSRPRRVILASSRSVYGEGAYVSESQPDKIIQPAPRSKDQLDAHIWNPLDENRQAMKAVPTPESLPFAPGSVYAATKASQELLISAAADALGFEPIIFRFQNVYGEGQSLQNPYTGIISIFFNRARQNLSIPIYEDGLESRDFIHIDDIVDGLMAAATAAIPRGAVLNLGSGNPTSVMELAQTLIATSGFDVPINVTGQFRLGDIRHCYADLTRAARVIDFKPKISLEKGLHRFCAWAVNQPVHIDKSDKAMAELRSRNLMGE
jgi:dTDP-L-rhamnose 4-epimerase